MIRFSDSKHGIGVEVVQFSVELWSCFSESCFGCGKLVISVVASLASGVSSLNVDSPQEVAEIGE